MSDPDLLLKGEIDRLHKIFKLMMLCFMRKRLDIVLLPLCPQNVHIHIVDMSSARQVWEFANNFSLNNTVHVLVGATVCRFSGPPVTVMQ